MSDPDSQQAATPSALAEMRTVMKAHAATSKWFRLMLELDTRDTSPGDVAQLRATALELAALIDEQPDWNREAVQRSQAQAVDWTARALDNLGDYHSAVAEHEAAAELWRAVGDQGQARQASRNALGDRLTVTGNIDAEMSRLWVESEALPHGSLERAEALLDVAGLYIRAGEDEEAIRRLELASAAIEEARAGDTHEDLLLAGARRLASGDNAGQELIDRSTTIQRLETVLAHALAQSYVIIDVDMARKCLAKMQSAPASPQFTAALEQIAAATEEAVQQVGSAAPARRWVAGISKFASNLIAGRKGTKKPTYSELLEQSQFRHEMAIMQRAMEFDIDVASAQYSDSELLAKVTDIATDAARLDAPELSAGLGRRQADLLLQLGEHERVVAVSSAALSRLGGRREHDSQPALLGRMARALVALDRWDEAEAAARRGIEMVERYRHGVNAVYLRDSYMRTRVNLYELATECACRRGDMDAVLRATELSKARGSGLPGTHLVGGQDPTAALALEELRSMTRVSRDDEHTRQRRRDLWDLAFAGGGTMERRLPEPPTVADVQAVVGETERVLYYYWLDDQRLLALWIGRRDSHMQILQLSQEDRRRIDRWSRLLVGGAAGVRPRDVADITRLADALVPEQDFLRDCRHLFISGHRILHTLPIHAMLTDGNPIVDRSAVTYLPNISALAQASPCPKDEVLGIAASTYAPTERLLADLPDALDELEEVKAIYDDAGRQGLYLSNARRDTVLDLATSGAISRFAILHFATHGQTVLADTPLESRLELHEEALDGLDVSQWNIDGATVVLAACSSGQRAIERNGRAVAADEVLGLQAAFFTAGAARVIGTMWPAFSDVARQISGGFHLRAAQGMPSHFALQESLNEYRRMPITGKGWPRDWAQFFLVARAREESHV